MQSSWENIVSSVEKALLLDYKRCFLASSSPLPAAPINQPICMHMNRFIIPLTGEKVIRYAENGQDIRRVFVPGEVLLIPFNAWDIEVWEQTHSMMSFVLFGNYLRVIYIKHNAGDPVPNGPDYFYHTSQPLTRSGLDVFSALSHLQPNSPVFGDLFRSFLKIVLDQLKNDEVMPLTKENLTWENVLNYVSTHVLSYINRTSIASAMRLHPSHLSRLFQKRMGIGVSEYITRQRMKHAADLLTDPSLSVGEIADICGYTSTSYFTRVFRHTFLLSPVKFRESVLGQKKQPVVTKVL